MKLGIFLLVFGLVIAGIGITTWISAGSYISNNPNDAGKDLYSLFQASGMGAIVIGGGLAIGGIIRMILRRN